MDDQAAHDFNPSAFKTEPPPMDKIATALAKAQAAITSPPRNREVEVVSKRTGGRYKFKYATLDHIIEHVRAPLTKNGLWFIQRLENGGGKYRLVTQLVHESGQSFASETPLLVEDQGNQSFGSALTYMRRYALCAMLGIAADEDDDANAADGNTVEKSAERKPRKAAPKAEPEQHPLRAAAERIKAGIDAHTDLEALNAFIVQEAEALNDIEHQKPETHKFLMDRIKAKRGTLVQGRAA